MRKTTIKTSHQQSLIAAACLAALAIASADAWAQKSEEEIAKAAQNPVAAMISLPLQYNYDQNIGPLEDGYKSYINVQPVIPFSLNEDWNLISRTIVPLIDQRDFPAAARNESGLGDITASLFFSPKAPSADGWIWGAGPVFLLPTATKDVLGAEKWGLGPTVVALNQPGPWTFGMLANHIWGAGGDDSRENVSATFLQPFLS